MNGQYLFNNFTEYQGLPSNTITSILKDNEGFIWIATKKGICRFDGHNFLEFTSERNEFPDLSQSDEFELFEDSKGIIWIATKDQGLYAFDPSSGKTLHFKSDIKNQHGISDDFVNFVFEDRKGNLWVSVHSHGLDLYNREENTFSHFKPSTQFPDLVARLADDLICYTNDPSEENVVWLGSLTGLFKLNTDSISWHYIPMDQSKSINPSAYSGSEKVVRSIVFDQTGYLWAGTWGGGLVKLDPTTETFDIFKYEQIQPVNGFRNNIRQLKWLNDDELWVVAPYHGLGIFRLKERAFDFMTNPETGEPLVHNPVCLLTDDLGFMWVGSKTHGLYTANFKVSGFTKTDLPFSLRTMTYDPVSAKLFAGTDQVNSLLLEINPMESAFKIYTYKPLTNQSENYFIKIMPGKGQTWIAESFNLYSFDEKQIRPHRGFVPSTVSFHKENNPFFIAADHHASGDIWLGSKFHGLFRVNPQKGEYENYYLEGGSYNSPGFEEFIYSLKCDSEGRVWYGSDDFGYYDYPSQKFINFQSDRDLPGSDIKILSVMAIIQSPDGKIWLGTEKNGIAVIQIENHKPLFVKSFTIASGLISNDIFDLASDGDGNVWAITGSGLSRIYASLDSVENYGYQYGITALHCLESGPDDLMFAGGDGGYYVFRPQDIKPFSNPVRPYIRSFSIFNKPVNLDQILDSAGHVSLRHDQNFFSLEFGLIDYFQTENRTFTYQLEGVDQGWQKASDRKTISYANVGGGKYLFRIRAGNGTELQLPVVIGTPFWKTMLFYILTATLLLLGLTGLYRFRLNHIRKQEELKTIYNRKINQLEMKALRAQMNPHFLFNSLNSIRYYILKEEFDNASDYITKFSRLLRLILRNSRLNMISLQEELETLGIYIEFEQMRFNRTFTYSLNIAGDVHPEGIMVQPMTLQPFVENAIWHGLMPKEGDRRLDLTLSQANNLLTITIEDNGVGRNHKPEGSQENDLRETRSYGLQITEERFAILREIRGKRSDFSITDLVDHEQQPAGTRVTIHYEL